MKNLLFVKDFSDSPEPSWHIDLTGYNSQEISDIIQATRDAMIDTQVLYDHECNHPSGSCNTEEI